MYALRSREVGNRSLEVRELPARDEPNIESYRALAEHSGLHLSDSELREMLFAASRTKRRALDVRKLVSDEDEPAIRFSIYSDHSS